MKKVYLILIFLLAPIWGFSQKKVIDYLPILFDTARVDVKGLHKISRPHLLMQKNIKEVLSTSKI